MELIRSFLAEADELLTRINEEVLALEANPADRERLNTVYRTAHTLKGSANLYGFSGVALLTHLLESLLDELRDGLQQMDAELCDLLLESFDQIRFLVRRIEGRQEDPQPESDLLHRLREVVRSDIVPLESNGRLLGEADSASERLPATEWGERLRAYLSGEADESEHTFQQFIAGSVRPGRLPATVPAWSEEVRRFIRASEELKRKRKNVGTTKEKLARLRGGLLELAEGPEADDERLLLLAAVPVMLDHVLEHNEADGTLPDWWGDVWEQWAADAERIAEGTAGDPPVDLTLDVWELCRPAQLSRRPFGALLAPNAAEDADGEDSELPAYAASAKEAAAATQAAAAPAAEPAMARQLVVEQLRFLAPRGKLLTERWELARRILKRCAALLGDKALQELAEQPAPDLARLKIGVKPYADHPDNVLAEPDYAALRDGLPDGSIRGPGKEGWELGSLAEVTGHDKIIRIEQGKIDRLMELIGELAVAKNVFPYLIPKIADYELAGIMKEKVAMLDRITKELQDAIVEVRMLPLHSVFSKFNRFVRDLAKQANKRVQLEITGEDTTLDKTLVESLSEPLIHLVRNAIDHGIELPEERKRRNKPAEGLLSLKAGRDGSKIWIEVRDDGGGIDTDLIRRKLLEQGGLTKEEAAGLTYDELLAHIYRAGFSTSDGVTSMSGRGVGMDAVMTNVRQMQGQLHVSSVPGEGTCIRIELPLTLTMTQVLQVVVGGRLYGIPLDQIGQTVRLEPQHIYTLQGRQVIKLDNRIVSLVNLRDKFGARNGANGCDQPYAAVMKSGIAISVDAFRGQQEVVIKPLDPALRKLDYLSGAAILGDGTVLLILNADGLIQLEDKR